MDLTLINELLNEGAWKKYGNHKGVLSRTVTPQEREEEERKKKEKAKAAYAKSKEGKLELAREEPIDDDSLTNDVLEKLDWGMGGLGGEIVDRWDVKNTYIKIDGVEVAAVKMTLMLSYDLKDTFGYGDETIKTMYNGNETAEDSVRVTVYRDPKNPKKLRGTF